MTDLLLPIALPVGVRPRAMDALLYARPKHVTTGMDRCPFGAAVKAEATGERRTWLEHPTGVDA